jgi:hypothetical protein
MNINDLVEIKRECRFCHQLITEVCETCSWYASVPNTSYSVMFNIVNNSVVFEKVHPRIFNPLNYSFNLCICFEPTKIDLYIDKIILFKKSVHFNTIINMVLPQSVCSSEQIKTFVSKLMKNYLYT